MVSNIELVDRADQNAREGGYGVFGDDLFLNEEGDGGQASQNVSEYLGLELEAELKRRSMKRLKIILALGLLSCVLIGAVVVYSKSSNSNGSNLYANGGNGNHKNNNNELPPIKPEKPSVSSSNNNDDNKNNEETSNTPWSTAAPLPKFKMCSPPRVAKYSRHDQLDVFHMMDIRIVPEALKGIGHKEEDEWQYTFSDMDMNEEASLLAVGLSDYSADTSYEVGMVRAFGYDCFTHRWKQVGQDLLGKEQYEQFGHRISSSGDGTVMAVAAPTDSSENGGKGYVEVYYLNENKWDLLGSRVERLSSRDNWYSRVGHAIDLSDKGDTLAVLATVDTDEQENSYIIRVFSYDENKKEWVRKGKNLPVTITYADSYDFHPQLSLSDDGDKLTMADPQHGLVTYDYHFPTGQWEPKEIKSAGWEEDGAWIRSADMDDKGNLIAFSGFDDDYTSNRVKIVDFSEAEKSSIGGTPGENNINGTKVYDKKFEKTDWDLVVAVSDNGNSAAVVASKEDYDDDKIWENTKYVGAMTILTTSGDSSDKQWRVVGEGTKAEGIGIPGNFVTLSGDGTVAAVGSSSVVAIYGINLKGSKTSSHTWPSSSASNNTSHFPHEIHHGSNSTHSESSAMENKHEAQKETHDSHTNSTKPHVFKICPPFSNITKAGHVGDLDNLPPREEHHTLALAMSGDGSVVAVGIDSYDNRGMVRVFAWDCESQSYLQYGEDLYGADDFDGFGQSVDLNSDGKVLVIGANQPPPGKSGYVEAYFRSDVTGHWSLIGQRMDDLDDLVEDVGREVKISYDGRIIMFSGSIVKQTSDGWQDTASFIRVVEQFNGHWIRKGEDLIGSISYDDYGANVHIAQSGDGLTMGVTGSYSNFLAKIYTFDSHKKNWTEILIPPIKNDVHETIEFDDDMYAMDYVWDVDYETFFSGSGIAIDQNATFVAIAGTLYTDNGENVTVRVLKRDGETGNFSLSRDPVEYQSEEWSPSSVDICADGSRIAVGISTHEGGDGDEQGALYVAIAEEDSKGGWNKSNKMDGIDDGDMLGSRVSITRDGSLAAASSRDGYVSFFKIVTEQSRL